MKAWPTFLLCALSFAGGGYLFLQYSPPSAASAVIMADEHIVLATKGGLLEVSRIEATEILEKTEIHALFGMDLPGPTITQIRLPVTYRYHVELDPAWRFIRSGKTFIAIAPPVKATLPVAFDTTRLQAYANGVWSIFTADGSIQRLQKTITPVLAERASSDKYRALQQAHARNTVVEFVRKWVVSQGRWAGEGYEVKVFFADEPLHEIQKNGLFPAPWSPHG